MVYHWQLKCLFNSLFRITARKHKSSALLALFGGNHQWPVDSPYKEPMSVECIFMLWHHHNNHKTYVVWTLISVILLRILQKLYMYVVCTCWFIVSVHQMHYRNIFCWIDHQYPLKLHSSICLLASLYCVLTWFFNWLIYWHCGNIMSFIFIGRYLKWPIEILLNIHYRNILPHFFIILFLIWYFQLQ